MKKNAFFALLLVLLIVLSACSNTMELAENSKSSSVINSSENITSETPAPNADSELPAEAEERTENHDSIVSRELSSGVKINADVFVPDMVDFSRLPTYNGEMKRLSLDGVREVLLGDQPVEQTEEEAKGIAFPDAVYQLFSTDDGTYLACTGESVAYFDSAYGEKDLYFRPDFSTEYNGDRFLTGKDFPFATRQQAFAEVKKVLGAMDIFVADDYRCYSVDHETLTEVAEEAIQQEIDRILELGQVNPDGSLMTQEDIRAKSFLPDPDYTEKDDCYYFRFYAGADGMPITRCENGIFDNGGGVPGSMIDVYYSADGIAQLYVGDIFQKTDELSADNGLDLEGAIQVLDDHFNSIIPDGSYEVKEISFEYVPISHGDILHVTLTPAWRFALIHTMEFDSKSGGDPVQIDSYEQIMFNALTGEEILRDLGGI